MITGSSSLWVVREEVRRRDRGVIECVHVSYDKVNGLETMGTVVDKLAELRGEEENMIRFVAVKISKKKELGVRMLHFEKIKVHGDMVREKSLLARVWF